MVSSKDCARKKRQRLQSSLLKYDLQSASLKVRFLNLTKCRKVFCVDSVACKGI